MTCKPQLFERTRGRSPDPGPAALVVGHPGHELRVFGWLAQARPRVFVLTDGGGGAGKPRLSATDELLANLVIARDPDFPVLSDRLIYDLMMSADPAPFIELAERLAAAFATYGIRSVAADAAEAYNPTHDLCRALVNTAVALLQRRTGATIANYEFDLTEWDRMGHAIHNSGCFHTRLDDLLFHRKLEAATGYLALRDEVVRALEEFGEEYFRVECLRPGQAVRAPEGTPYYEVVGEDRVRRGVYSKALRYADHMRPIFDGLDAYASRATMASASAS